MVNVQFRWGTNERPYCSFPMLVQSRISFPSLSNRRPAKVAMNIRNATRARMTKGALRRKNGGSSSGPQAESRETVGHATAPIAPPRPR